MWEEMLIGDVTDGASGDQEQGAAARPQHSYLISLSGESPDKTVLIEGKFKALLIDAEKEKDKLLGQEIPMEDST